MDSPSKEDVPMESPSPPDAGDDEEPKYGGFTRFEIELEVSTAFHSISQWPASYALLRLQGRLSTFC
jgi:hypothetical protein